jgi:hypothetical protein
MKRGKPFLALRMIAFALMVIFQYGMAYGYSDKNSTSGPLLHDTSPVMFWRPQKVGSSTMSSILFSYSYRYDFLVFPKTGTNMVCKQVNFCSGSLFSPTSHSDPAVKMSSYHEVCDLARTTIEKALPCVFSQTSTAAQKSFVKELIMVRNPLERAISIYYFWGELALLKKNQQPKQQGSASFASLAKPFVAVKLRTTPTTPAIVTTKSSTSTTRDGSRATLEKEGGLKINGSKLASSRSSTLTRIGSTATNRSIDASKFKYHGNELTVPPLDVARSYAANLPLTRGLPGPSFTWSLFANNWNDAVEAIKKKKVVTIVLERLDESLVAASHYLGWSLADIVVAKFRKSMSSHPKANQWDKTVIEDIRTKLVDQGEYKMYDASVEQLKQRISTLESKGVNFEERLMLYRALQHHARKVSWANSVPLILVDCAYISLAVKNTGVLAMK